MNTAQSQEKVLDAPVRMNCRIVDYLRFLFGNFDFGHSATKELHKTTWIEVTFYLQSRTGNVRIWF